MDNFVDAYNEFVLGAGTEEEGQSDILVIDNDLRTIAIPSDLLLGVESDENVRRLHFQMPRYYDDVDLSEYLIRVNYMNANGVGDVYVVEDKTVGTDSITFSWLVGRTATQYKGKTAFVICLRIIDASYAITNEYNTTVHYLPVLEGLETEAQPFERQPDILEQLLVRLTIEVENAKQEVIQTGAQYVESAAASAQSASDSATSALSSKNAAAASAADAATEKAEVYSAVEAVEDTVYDVDGLKDMLDDNSKTGGLITVEDAAPVTAKKVLLTLKPHQDLHGYDHPWPAGGGKNKFDYENTGISLVGITNTNGTFSNSTADSRSTFECRVQAFNGNTQVVSSSLTVSSTGRKSITITISSEVTLLRIKHNGGIADLIVNYPWTEQGTFTVSFNVTGYNPSVAGGLVFNDVQVEAGSTATDYAPYANICPIEGYNAVVINHIKENLLTPDMTINIGSYYNDDGTVTNSGGTKRVASYIPVEAEKHYIIDAPNNNSTTRIRIHEYDADKTWLRQKVITTQGLVRVEWVSSSDAAFIRFSLGDQAEPVSVGKGEFLIENISINQWDEEWEVGGYDNTGAITSATNQIRSKNNDPIPVKGGASYCFVSNGAGYVSRICWYDINDNFISVVQPSTFNVVTTAPSNACWMKFNMQVSYGTTYNHDISINYPASFTDYFSYTGNGVAYNGTIDLGTGKMVLDRASVDLGTLIWESYQSWWQTTISDIKYVSVNTEIANAISDRFTVRQASGFTTATAGQLAVDISNIKAKTGTGNSPTGQLVYELATPVTIQLTPQQLQMLKGLNYVWTDADNMELDYYVDKDKKLVVVGNAEQLLSKEMTNDQEPYLFRASGGNGADREYDTLVGGTVAWNQLVNELPASGGNYGLTWTNTDNKTLRIVGTPTTTAFSIAKTYRRTQVGHKLMITGGKENAAVRGGQSLSYTYADTGTGIIIEALVETASQLAVQFPTPYPTIDVTLEPRCYDLTEMFGSTIADYAYTLDQANKGAGVAWLKSYGFFSKYAPYDAGSLISTKAEKKKVVGFNLWNEEWEVGRYNDSGETASASAIRSKAENYIPVVPNTSYCLHSGNNEGYIGRICWYDADKNFISVDKPNNNNAVVASPSNACYCRFNTQSTYGTTYNNDICINISKTTGIPKNGDYVPYTTYEYPLDSNVILRGIPKLDSNNKLYYDGDKYQSDGKITRRYGLVDLGTLTFSNSTLSGRTIFATANGILPNAVASNNTAPNTLCPVYSWHPNTQYDRGDKFVVIDGNKRVIIVDTSLTDASQLSLSGVYLLYELATPYFEQADPFEPLQVLDPYGTEEYVDGREVPIPVGHDTNYPANLRAEVERMMKQIPEAPSANGTYVLKVIVSGGVPNYEWVVE